MKVTPLKISIHNENVNPVFGETAIHVEVMDNATGGFLKIETFGNFGDDVMTNAITLELRELEIIYKEGKKLLECYEKNCGD